MVRFWSTSLTTTTNAGTASTRNRDEGKSSASSSSSSSSSGATGTFRRWRQKQSTRAPESVTTDVADSMSGDNPAPSSQEPASPPKVRRRRHPSQPAIATVEFRGGHEGGSAPTDAGLNAAGLNAAGPSSPERSRIPSEARRETPPSLIDVVESAATSPGVGSGGGGGSSGSSPRRRLNSRDIPRTYAGLYGNTDDLLPFELNRHPMDSQTIGFLLASYLILILLVEAFFHYTVLVFAEYFVFSSLHPPDSESTDEPDAGAPSVTPSSLSWTLTNLTHLLLTLVYVHWLKGNMCDSQGETNALTMWEQLEGTSNTATIRRTLLIVPTLLTYAACHFADYRPFPHCAINITAWIISMLAKLPCMNGVRIFGINRTAGIDDEDGDDGAAAAKRSRSLVGPAAAPSPSSFDDASGTSGHPSRPLSTAESPKAKKLQ